MDALKYSWHKKYKALISTRGEKSLFALIYKNVWLYRLSMWLLYRNQFRLKYELVSNEIPEGSSVVDLCCGDCAIAPLIFKKGCTYTGFDINPSFVQWSKAHGYDARLWDGIKMDFPKADIICMQSALYHFIPNDTQMVEKMLERAKKKVVITEPVENFLHQRSETLTELLQWLTRVEGRTFPTRHTVKSMEALAQHFAPHATLSRPLKREVLLVISKT